jgi:CheY-like chemotaxis protein
VKTVLVVDDDYGIAEALSDVLSEEGFAVTVVRNGKDALKRVAEHRPDIVLLDYMMPVMDGCAVLRALKADPAHRTIPVVMMSAAPRSSMPADCKPSAFLRKPFDLDVLLKELHQALTPAEQR